MSEIDWDDNATKAVERFTDWLAATERENMTVTEMLGYFMNDVVYKPATQQKAVTDAYEWSHSLFHHGNWAYDDCDAIVRYGSGGLSYAKSSSSTRVIVCTREQFEAYAKEQESKQEGEKWTHIHCEIEECRLLENEPDAFGMFAIETAGNGFIVCSKDELKPIKPKLTKAEAWDRCMEEFGVRNIKYVMQELMDEFDII